MSITNLLTGLDRFRAAALAGAFSGLQTDAARITQTMQATNAHGDVTGATRANYRAVAVGPDHNGSVELASMVAAVESHNPGASAVQTVALDGALGVLIQSATDYQIYLETENAGAHAVLGPTLAANATLITAAAAAGSKAALG